MDENKPPISSLFYALIFVSFLGLFGAVVLTRFGNEARSIPTKRVPRQDNQLMTTTPASGRGLLSVKNLDGHSIFTRGEEIALIAFADSSGTPIVSFDIVASFDPHAAQFISSTSRLQDFKLFDSHDQNSFFITGYQDSNVSRPAVLSGSAIASVSLRALAEGRIDLKVISKPGQLDDSNFMDGETNDILDSSEAPDLYVGKEFVLVKGQEVLVRGDNIKLMLTSTVVPVPDCVDCIISAKIQVALGDGSKTETIEFLSGGIAGFDEMIWKTNELIIEVIKIEKGRVTVRVAR